MAHALCLQDWITVAGDARATLTQSTEAYLDAAAYQDLVPYVEISQISGSPTLTIQTSPTLDEPFWGSIAQYTTSGLQLLTIVRGASASVPPARFLRWTVTSMSNFSITFRIWLSARPMSRRLPGLRAPCCGGSDDAPRRASKRRVLDGLDRGP